MSTYAFVILLLGIAILIIQNLYFFYGYFGYDDMHYAKLSYTFLNGTLDFSNHYSYRWTILFLTTLSYHIFGISDFSVALPSLALSCGILGLMYLTFRHNPFILAMSILLYFSVRWNIFYADKLMPDIYVSFFLFTAWLSYDKMIRKAGHYYLNSTVFVLSLFFAFLSKGTVILIVPLLNVYFLWNVKEGNLTKWKYPLLLGSFVLALYFILIYVMTGHPFSRFHAIEDNSYFNACSYNQMPISVIVNRITVGFVQLAWNESLLKFLVIAIAAKIYVYYNVSSIKLKKRISFYCTTILILFFSMNFMTISLSSYNPACLDIRHYLFSIPIMSVCVGYILQDLSLTKRIKMVIIIVAFISVIPTLMHMRYAKSLHFNETKEDIVNIVAELQNENAILISNQVMLNLINFYSKYEFDGKLFSAKEFTQEQCEDNCYIVSNWYTEFHSSTDLDNIKDALEKDEIELEFIPQSTDGYDGMVIHKIVIKK